MVDFIRPVGIESYLNYNFSYGPFWTHKLKPKLKYKIISSILLLLSTPDSTSLCGIELLLMNDEISEYLLTDYLDVYCLCSSRADGDAMADHVFITNSHARGMTGWISVW